VYPHPGNQTKIEVLIDLMQAVKNAILFLCRRARAGSGTRRNIACRKHAGFNLLELVIALSLIGVMAAIAYPSYMEHVDKGRNAIAASDIAAFAQGIERFYTAFNRYPDSLAEIGLDGMLDPWGNRYRYLRINGANLKGKAALRKDKSLVPVNSDFDLYSMGKDGATLAPFTAKVSHDDIVRASNGRYIGPAADY
jgi:general secretion pathway protein G